MPPDQQPNQRIELLRSLGEGPDDRAAKAQRAVDLIRRVGPYRWAGLYDVLPTEIVWWRGRARKHQRIHASRSVMG